MSCLVQTGVSSVTHYLYILSRRFIEVLFHPSKGTMIWKRSTRIGEAQNPGPTGSTVTTAHLTFSLLNPTTIYQKEDELLGLNADILCLAETATTRNVQAAFNQAIRTTKYHTYWSAPVPDKITKTDPTLGYTLRGDNLGTAVLTRLPSRDARHTFTSSAWETCRMNSAIVSTGVVDVLVVSTYFHTGKSAEARIVNNQLLQDILQHVLSTDLPFVIAGDFNMDIQKLDAWPFFSHMGCCEMFEFHRRAFGSELPPTCKGATRFDSMILHPTLLPHILRIDIGPEHQFADHCAVHVQLNLPATHLASQTWFVPKSWTLLHIKGSEFAHQYRKVRHRCPIHVSDDASTSLYQWSAHIEKAVDLTLQSQRRLDPLVHSQRFLPKTHRGRCATPRLIHLSSLRSPKKDWAGCYEPPVEVTSLRSRHKVRQVRRLRCLEQLYKKYTLADILPANWPSLPQFHSLVLQWQAIRLANGYGNSWTRWLLQFEAIDAVPTDLPTLDQLYTVRQITQYDADLYCQQEAKLRRLSNKYGMELDVQHKSSSRFYKQLRAQESKVLPGFPTQLRAQATLQRMSKGPIRLVLHQPVAFRLYAAARFGDATLRIVEQQANSLTCQVLEGVLPTHGDIQQNIYAFELPDMVGPFAQYWSQFWNRDTPEDEQNDQAWDPLLHSLLNRIPPQTPLAITWTDPHILTRTIQRLKPFKAVGIDGWRAEELQLLPHEAIHDLANIFAHIWPKGLSTHQMIARVILLAKKNPPTSINDGRPITILGYLSRLTSKLIADQLLSHWTQTWPSAISGGLPSRGVQDITFLQQFHIEKAKNRSAPWRGFTLDLIKAFNLLPRRVIYHLLIYHGVPPDSIQFWFHNLRKMTRRLQVRNCVGPPLHMTTGVPEGDSLSVCAMLVVSSAFYWTIQSPTVFPFAYADNWSYLATNQRDNILTFRRIQDFVHAFRMQIDYAKSWAWGATSDARQDWTEFLNQEFPDSNQVPVLNSTKDLGCMTHYTRHITLGHLKTKIHSAIQRCRRIRRFPTDLLQKARFIQTAVWPHAFFGAETQVVGDSHFRTLRREAAMALIGPESQISSWLAVHVFSQQLQDPLLYVISTALAFLRRMYHINPALACEFTNAVLSYTGPAIGPAGALARYLNIVGWSLQADGSLVLDGYLSISLQHDSLASIRSALRQAWAYHIHRNICHRKGATDHPFDYTLLSRVIQSMSVTTIRQIAYNLTGGYQVGAVKAQWTSTVDANCPFCGQVETHSHQQLDCPDFAHVRKRHPLAVRYLQDNPDKLWLPLPHSCPDLEVIRQLLRHRGTDTEHTTIRQEGNVLYFYTDGSADTPIQPVTRRAAWSVVQFLPDMSTAPFLTIKIQHVNGAQTIARAELAAVAWIVQHAATHQWHQQIVITTDSQYVINVIRDTTNPANHPSWHRIANADLQRIIAQFWQPTQFVLRKVRSHQDITSLPPGPIRDDALGNSCLDARAVC